MTTNFIDAADKYVAARIVYGKAADSKIYLEAAYTNQAPQAEVEDAFLKGVLLVKVGDAYFKPVSISGNKVLTVALTGSPAALAGTEWTAKASE